MSEFLRSNTKRQQSVKKPSLFIISLWSLLLACQPPHSEKLTIATAANMQFAIGEITQAFTEKTGIACEAIISSSGKLTAQIREGAPFDVFVSADMKYPTALFESGLTTAPPEVYAYGRLVLWSMVGDLTPSVEALTKEEISHIALANPKTAPYGVAAVEVLKRYTIYNQVEKKLVFGESIAQTNQFIISQAAEVGFTAKAVVLSHDMQAKGRWQEIDTALYSPLAQGVVILSNQESRLVQAQRFYAFLFSKEGQAILTKFGYAVST